MTVTQNINLRLILHACGKYLSAHAEREDSTSHDALRPSEQEAARQSRGSLLRSKLGAASVGSTTCTRSGSSAGFLRARGARIGACTRIVVHVCAPREAPCKRRRGGREEAPHLSLGGPTPPEPREVSASPCGVMTCTRAAGWLQSA